MVCKNWLLINKIREQMKNGVKEEVVRGDGCQPDRKAPFGERGEALPLDQPYNG
jgi:hypothetical protein